MRERLRDWAFFGTDEPLIARLPIVQKKVIYARYRDTLSWQLVAKSLNYSVGRVKHIEIEALDSMSAQNSTFEGIE